MKKFQTKPLRRVRVEIDLEELVRNWRKIRQRCAPLETMCVLKANAYALGVGAYAKALSRAGCSYFGVAEPYEALELKEALGEIPATVQILSSVIEDEIPAMVAAGVVLPVTGLEEAKAISASACEQGRTARVHFKIDTGMGRLGILEKNAVSIVKEVVKLPNLDCEGIFSHCPMAYAPEDDYTAWQIERFKSLVAELRNAGICFRRVHIAASDAINNFPQSMKPPFTTVRTGINLHGSFDPNGLRALDLASVLTLKTRIAQVRELDAGTTLGYSRTWCLAEKTRVATISAGYADGLPLALSNRGAVLVAGVRCPVIGRISMDYATVDVSRVPDVKSGDEVVCLGRSGSHCITPDDWAALKGTHAYDIICSFGSRVERVVKGLEESNAQSLKEEKVVLSLGSNIHPRREYLFKAIEALSHLPQTRFLAQSSIYETKGEDVPAFAKDMDFLNMAAIFSTSLEPLEFLGHIHEIEKSLGRERDVKNGPRTIDIDIVEFGTRKMDTPQLTLPHPRAACRRFVVSPLAELGITLQNRL